MEGNVGLGDPHFEVEFGLTGAWGDQEAGHVGGSAEKRWGCLVSERAREDSLTVAGTVPSLEYSDLVRCQVFS